MRQVDLSVIRTDLIGINIRFECKLRAQMDLISSSLIGDRWNNSASEQVVKEKKN